jgi:hypothetical protein
VTGLLHAEDPLDPGHDLVRGGVGGLVEVDHTIANVVIERALKRRVTRGDGGVVSSADKELVVVLYRALSDSKFVRCGSENCQKS